MKKIKILDIELFSSLIEFEIANSNIDLHNDYCCSKIQYNEETLFLLFTTCSDAIEEREIKLTFHEVELYKVNLEFERTKELITIDNFYRGRFENEGNLLDLSSDGKGYIYIEFYEGHSIEFSAKELVINEEEL
jgi:hypothetical protein